MKQIELVNNNGVVLVDDEDYTRLNVYRWYLLKRKRTSYACTNMKVDGRWKGVRMHRFILNAPENTTIDHRNHNGLDNQKCNLRLCTQSQNCMNRRKTKSSSQFKGVSWFKPTNKWQAHIRIDGTLKHLGHFNLEIEAAKAYNKAAIKYFGEFANLNIIERN